MRKMSMLAKWQDTTLTMYAMHVVQRLCEVLCDEKEVFS